MFTPVFTPRFSLLKKLFTGFDVNLLGSFSRGLGCSIHPPSRSPRPAFRLDVSPSRARSAAFSHLFLECIDIDFGTRPSCQRASYSRAWLGQWCWVVHASCHGTQKHCPFTKTLHSHSAINDPRLTGIAYKRSFASTTFRLSVFTTHSLLHRLKFGIRRCQAWDLRAGEGTRLQPLAAYPSLLQNTRRQDALHASNSSES